ncbi:hypothetical protein CDCA_CDCA10G2879 [Cyanidium caldarium]|uniref:Uncharacterized protein n=1 Tax=Cyanidium caldarium TaxID=2771 RepID=A0AAV9IXL8_CYACA|nr:hypothetical protein CDCA_CDCA10G2879 [Cyanidium caldarium]
MVRSVIPWIFCLLILGSLASPLALCVVASHGAVMFVATLRNSEAILPNFIVELERAVDHIHTQHRMSTAISVYESGSIDGTKNMLQAWHVRPTRFGRRVIVCANDTAPEAALSRLDRLARARNRALRQARQLWPRGGDEYAAYYVFLNDVFFQAADLLQLIDAIVHGDYNMVCAMDFYRGFYDRWVTRGPDGSIPSRWPPFFMDAPAVFERGRPIVEVESCWNGLAVVRASAVPQAFRAEPVQGCVVSECQIFANEVRQRRNDSAGQIAVLLDTHIAYDPLHYQLQRTLMHRYRDVFRRLNSLSRRLVHTLFVLKMRSTGSERPCPLLPMLCC